MKGFVAAAAATVALATGAAARTFTVYNNCPFTIWYVLPISVRFVPVLTMFPGLLYVHSTIDPSTRADPLFRSSPTSTSALLAPTTRLGAFMSHSHFQYIAVLTHSPHSWEQRAYQAVSFSVPDNWKAGRIWVSATHTLPHNERAL